MKKQAIIAFLLLLSNICWGQVSSDNATTIFGEQNGTNAGRYRSVKFSNGTTTNNNDGSISINNNGGGGGSGNVGIGTANWVAYYPANGSTVAANASLQFDASGNVDIGFYNVVSANPTQLIFGEYQTSGATRPALVLNTPTNWIGLGQTDSGFDDNLRLGPVSDPPTSPWPPLFGTGAFNFTIDGNVGIGTYGNSGSTLDVVGTGWFHRGADEGAIFGSGTKFSLASDAYMLATADSGKYAGYSMNCDAGCFGASVDWLSNANGATGWSLQALGGDTRLLLLDRINGLNEMTFSQGGLVNTVNNQLDDGNGEMIINNPNNIFSNFTVNDPSASPVLQVNNTDGAGGTIITRLNILDDGSGNSYFQGNVGIGDSGLSAKLGVETISDSSGGNPTNFDNQFMTVGAGAGSGGNIALSFDQANGIGYIYSLYPNNAWQDLAIRASHIYLQSTTSSSVTTNNNMLDNGSGNVGIGTLSPTSLLDVKRKFNVLLGGNVGIGTINPSAGLEIEGTSTLKVGMPNGLGQINVLGGITATNNASNAYATTNPPIGGMILSGNVGVGTNLPSSLLEIGARRFNVLSGGNVGIGSNSPGSLLDIKGNARVVTGVYGVTQASPPTIVSNGCGSSTQGVIASGSTDLAGSVTAGTNIGNLLSCVVTFGQSHTTAPASCVCQDSTTPLALAATYNTTTVTCTSLATLVSAVISYQCQWNTP